MIVAVSALSAAAAVLVPGRASAASLQYWAGKVTKVADGDTIYVDIENDGKGPVPIRNTNIQATEMSGGPGGGPECHAVDATNYMKRLVPVGARVHLGASNPASTSGVDGAGATRLLRYVDVLDTTIGHYVDVQLKLVQAGLVMAGANPGETARYQQYAVAEQQAMAAGLGLFDDDSCGVGPAAGAKLSMWVHYDAGGADGSVPNGEWMRIMNKGTADVSLAGWKLRDSGHTWYRGSTYYTFPSYTKVPAGRVITIYPGTGTNNATTGVYYLGVTNGAFFPNVVSGTTSAIPGKTMYLLDPQLDFRAWAAYPCLYNCSKPPVHISYVQYKTADEYIDITTNTGVLTPVSLTGVEVENDGWTKELHPNTVLNPGETLRLYCERSGSPTRLVQYWGRPPTMLEDSGDTVILRTAASTVLSTVRWGTG